MRGFGYKYTAVALLCVGARLEAQRVAGHTRDATGGAPLPGAVVFLADSAGRTIARTISGTGGEFRLLGDGSAATVRALRIGFRPTTKSIARAEADANVTVDVDMTAVPTLLEAVEVHDQARCPARDDGPSAFALWEQVRAALLASVVAKEANPAALRVFLYDRTLRGLSDQIAQQIVAESLYTASQAFVAERTPADYERLGYVETDTAQLHQRFHVPIAEIFLDSTFVRSHCLSLHADDRHHPHDVGLAFVPAPRTDSVVDIDGVIWIRRSNPQLQSLEFKYTNLDRAAAAAKPGGSLEFTEMANGIVLATRWNAHIPQLTRGTGRFGARSGLTARFAQLTGVHDVGAEVAEASWPSGLVWRDSLTRIEGHVFADGGRTPAVGAVVRLQGTRIDTETDSSGAFAFPTLLPGPYDVEAADTILATYGITATTATHVDLGRASAVRVSLTLPPRSKAVATVCGAVAKSTGSTPGGNYLLSGRAALASGAPAGGASIRIQWPDAANPTAAPLRYSTHADSSGEFVLCGVPPAVPLTLTATRDSLVSPDAHVLLDASDHIAQRTLVLSRPEVAGLPEFRLRRLAISDGSSLTPLADVDVTDAFGGTIIGRTSAKGEVSLAPLPEGRSLVRLRKVGYEQRVEIVVIGPEQTAPVNIVLRTVTQLAAVKVTATAGVSARAASAGFQDRSSSGFGHFLFPKDFDRTTGDLGPLLTRLGMHPVTTIRGTFMSGSHGGKTCPVTIYVDGALFYMSQPGVDPPDVRNMLATDYAGAEYYVSAAETPVEYNATGSGCGTLVLWTRDG